MRWLRGGRVLEPDGSRFVRADIGVEGDRIARVATSASTAAGSCPASSTATST
jgi:dihydroorotase-like cyclic amidohydrolase